jgi:hypothetical protein
VIAVGVPWSSVQSGGEQTASSPNDQVAAPGAVQHAALLRGSSPPKFPAVVDAAI